MSTCHFETELESAIAAFTDNRQSFTSMDVRNKIRDLHQMPVQYRETNYATLTFMQHNGKELRYIAEPIEVLTGEQDHITHEDIVASVWQFTPRENVEAAPEVKDLKVEASDSEDPDDKHQVTPRSGGLFNRLFGR